MKRFIYPMLLLLGMAIASVGYSSDVATNAPKVDVAIDVDDNVVVAESVTVTVNAELPTTIIIKEGIYVTEIVNKPVRAITSRFRCSTIRPPPTGAYMFI